MLTFQNDDAIYMQWITDHPAGFVVNVPYHAASTPLVLHTATCSSIKAFASKNPTIDDYYKAWGMNRDELVTWANQKGKFQECKVCKPLSAPPISVATSAQPSSQEQNPSAAATDTCVAINNGAGVTMQPGKPSSSKAATEWRLWVLGQGLRRVDGIEPLLACWEKKGSPPQVRMQKYLDELMTRIGQLPDTDAGLYLHLDVDVHDPKKLLHGYDLENYLTPLFGPKRLDPARFYLVSATKRVVGGSHLTIGHVIPKQPAVSDKSWKHFSLTDAIDKDVSVWQLKLYSALVDSHPQLLPAGQVAVQIAWRCHPDRALKWVNWWKPTGDAMGPVLGEPQEPVLDEPHKKRFNPFDDRITSLALHLNADSDMPHPVDVGMWWPATIT